VLSCVPPRVMVGRSSWVPLRQGPREMNKLSARLESRRAQERGCCRSCGPEFANMRSKAIFGRPGCLTQKCHPYDQKCHSWAHANSRRQHALVALCRFAHYAPPARAASDQGVRREGPRGRTATGATHRRSQGGGGPSRFRVTESQSTYDSLRAPPWPNLSASTGSNARTAGLITSRTHYTCS
jgi:hypothetical protein